MDRCDSNNKCNRGQALILIKFECSRFCAFRNSIIKDKSIIANYGNGRFVGAAKHIKLLDGFWNPKFTWGALLFDSTKTADHWSWSDHDIKQQDWIGQADMHLIPLLKPFPESDKYNGIVIYDLTVQCDCEIFEESYIPQHSQIIEKHGGISTVACVFNPKKLRGTTPLGYTIIDVFPCEEAFEQFRESECYPKLQQYRQQLASGNVYFMNIANDYNCE